MDYSYEQGYISHCYILRRNFKLVHLNSAPITVPTSASFLYVALKHQLGGIFNGAKNQLRFDQSHQWLVTEPVIQHLHQVNCPTLLLIKHATQGFTPCFMVPNCWLNHVYKRHTYNISGPQRPTAFWYFSPIGGTH